jgi:hypothetical protein
MRHLIDSLGTVRMDVLVFFPFGRHPEVAASVFPPGLESALKKRYGAESGPA